MRNFVFLLYDESPIWSSAEFIFWNGFELGLRGFEYTFLSISVGFDE